MNAESRVATMRALLAKYQPDGLDEKRTVRVIYATSDGRERIGWHERVKLRIRQRFEKRA